MIMGLWDYGIMLAAAPALPESGFFGVMLYILYLVNTDIAGQAESLQAGKANSYPEYVSIPVKISCSSFESGKGQINQFTTNWLISLLECDTIWRHIEVQKEGWTLGSNNNEISFDQQDPIGIA